MIVAHAKPSVTHPKCELRLGVASWDDGSGSSKSIKFTWFDKNNKAARGGEFPVEALPEALQFAIENGYVNIAK